MPHPTLACAALGVLALSALPGTATATPPPRTAATSARPAPDCSRWHDNAGPGGAFRYHVNCDGYSVYVQAKVVCADGTSVKSAWRYGYAKAECPYGVRSAGWTGWGYRWK
ncbi:MULTISPECIES: hypothetical protein [Streptomyces]|uniref:Secreted protein n=1 Tax=Streptomyces ramulosus TaxID=47762 RepID=A0ABW1FEG2_9ACTN